MEKVAAVMSKSTSQKRLQQEIVTVTKFMIHLVYEWVNVLGRAFIGQTTNKAGCNSKNIDRDVFH